MHSMAFEEKGSIYVGVLGIRKAVYQKAWRCSNDMSISR
jgi:hypothetical protein